MNKCAAYLLMPVLMFLSIGLHAQERAVVEFSANMMRENPDYAAELGDQSLMGTVVEVLGQDGYWVKIRTPEPYTAWVTDMGLVRMDEKGIQDYLEAPKYICTVPYSHIYEEPSLKSGIVSELLMGDVVRIMYRTITHRRGRYRGYEDVDVFYKWAKDKKAASGDAAGFARDIEATARLFLGVPYLWGGSSIKNVDCSGLTRSVFFSNGVLLPRNASQQGRIGADVRLFNDSGETDWSALEPGDLVFWGREATDEAPAKATHVGIYLGDGKFIHSSQVVRISSLDRNDPDFYDRKPIMARRIIGHVDETGSGIVSIFQSPDYIPQE